MATYRDTLNEIVKMNPEQQFSLAVSSSNKVYEYLESHGFNKNEIMTVYTDIFKLFVPADKTGSKSEYEFYVRLLGLNKNIASDVGVLGGVMMANDRIITDGEVDILYRIFGY